MRHHLELLEGRQPVLLASPIGEKWGFLAAPRRFRAFVAKTQQSRLHGSTYKFLQNVLAKQGGISHTLQLRVDRSVFLITFTGDSIMAMKKKSKGKKPAPK